MRFRALSSIGVVYHVDGWGWSEVKGIIVVGRMVVGNEGCEMGIAMYVKMVIGLHRGWGRTWTW